MVDTFISATAAVIFVAVVRRHRPMGRGVCLLLAFITAAWLWANLRTTGWQDAMGHQMPPKDLDVITESMFYRGWPLSPFMLCDRRGMKFQPGIIERFAVVANLAILYLFLLFARTGLSFINSLASRPRSTESAPPSID